MGLIVRKRFRIGLLIAAGLIVVSSALAGHLPERRYTISDGLANDTVTTILADSRGFLWACTLDGLSRFDGREFVNYRIQDGMPARQVMDIVENPDGSYYLGFWTNRIVLFDPSESDRSKLFHPITVGRQGSKVVRLRHRSDGRLWVGTTAGLYLQTGNPEEEQFTFIPLGEAGHARPRIWDLAEDKDGNLWIATGSGLLRRTPGGDVTKRPLIPGNNIVETYTVMVDSADRVWVGHAGGASVFFPRSTPDRENGDEFKDIRFITGLEEASTQGFVALDEPGDTAWYGEPDIGAGLSSALLQTRDGTIWLAMVKGGLTSFDGERFYHYEPGVSLTPFLSRALTEDFDGNLWIGSLDRGITRLALTGISSFDETAGLKFSSNATLALDSHEQISVIAGDTVYPFDGDRFQAIRPSFLAGHTSGRTGENASALLDRSGRWWFGTPHGLYRFPAGTRLGEFETIEPEIVYSTRNGLPANVVTALYEDSTGNIWIGLDIRGSFSRWNAADQTLQTFTEADGVPEASVIAIVETQPGDLWIGLDHGVTRYRNENFTPLTTADNTLFHNKVNRIFLDSTGSFWIATNGSGVYLFENPDDERPQAKRYSTAQGLANDVVNCIEEDREGRLYFGTSAGISRLDPGTDRITNLTTRQGLSNNAVWNALRDPAGKLWFSSRRGVTQIIPQAEPADPKPPEVRITGLRISGSPYPVAEIGEVNLHDLRIQPGRNRVEIDFGGISLDPDSDLQYEFRLIGTDEPWSKATPLRGINYASLAPGRYRFAVRAIDTFGRAGSEASVDFRVLRPVWQQWWFMLIAFMLAVGAIYAVHRYQLSKVIEVERVRTRIATDLHDDVGSSLSQIAILSEVVHRRVDKDNSEITRPLSRIAQVSRELVDSMSDIVWATNPRFDKLSDLVHRMRRFASDTLTASDIEFSFHVPTDSNRSRLGIDTRRQVYLIFKEAIHNAVRHSDCTEMAIRFEVKNERLQLQLKDNGSGMSAEDEPGHGLDSMRNRAQGLGGVLQIDSEPGTGTTLTLSAPLRSR